MEQWKDISGYTGLYQASNLGRIKSLERICSNGKGFRGGKERVLKPQLTANKYYAVKLCLDGVCKTKDIHQLVAIAFLNHKPNGIKIVVDHIDHNQLNNNLCNLQLISHRENCSKDRKGYSSDIIGVSWNKNRNKWISQIKLNGVNTYLGLFNTEKEAGNAYHKATRTL